MSEQGIQLRARMKSNLAGLAPEPPPRLTNLERTQMRKGANEALKRSEARMAAKVKFTPKCAANSRGEHSHLLRTEGTPVSNG